MNFPDSSIDPRTRRYLSPARLLWQSEGETTPRDAALLLRDNGGQAAGGMWCCALPQNGGLLLDFGRELYGGLQIVTGGTPFNLPAMVRIRFGESVSEAMSQPNNDHAMHDLQCQLPPMGTCEIGNTGFRFARIDMVSEGAAQISGVRAMSLLREDEILGSFRCDDERLNRIWQTGARTVHLCMQDFLWDGIKRDRMVWCGDMHPEAMTIAAVFGDHAIVRQSLDFARDHTPLPAWMNGIGSYSMWWVLMHHMWHQRFGNRDYLQQQRDYLCGLLRLLCAQAGEDNRERFDGRRFLDWPSHGDDAALHAGLHSLLVMALEAGSELCETLGENATRQQCLETADRLRRHVPALDASSKQAASLLALSGLVAPREANCRVLSVAPLGGLSTFYGYYVLQARALAGDYAGCLEVIRRYWGAMLDLGATSFWEHFDLSWMKNAARIDEFAPRGGADVHASYGEHCYVGHRHSLCHGWASGPTAWLSEHVLGIKPLEAGCSKMLIAPRLEDLSWVEGAFPTPQGVLRVRHRKVGNRIESEWEAPSGVQVVRASEIPHSAARAGT